LLGPGPPWPRPKAPTNARSTSGSKASRRRSCSIRPVRPNDNAIAGYDSARQGVAQAEAILQSAQTDLDHTTILSPIAGKAVQLNAHEGEVVITGTMNNPGSVIAVIADLSEILVEADVGETEITGIRLNEPSKVHVERHSDKEYTGHVAEIGSSLRSNKGRAPGCAYFKVKVQIDNPDDRLRPGMTAQGVHRHHERGKCPFGADSECRRARSSVAGQVEERYGRRGRERV